MVVYYKVSADLLKEYIRLIQERLAYVGVAVSLKYILSDAKSWVMDDVDYPEAVEAAEILAFGKPETTTDASRSDGYRWMTDHSIGRIIKLCYARSNKLVGVFTTLINHSPYPHEVDDRLHKQIDEAAKQLAQR